MCAMVFTFPSIDKLTRILRGKSNAYIPFYQASLQWISVSWLGVGRRQLEFDECARRARETILDRVCPDRAHLIHRRS